jgi:hypothetical protein
VKIKHSEKELYRIFTDLTKHGRCSYSYPNSQAAISRSIALRTKPLIEAKPPLVFPPTSSYRSNQIKEPRSFIQLPIGVELVEKKGNKSSIFIPRRKRIL